MTTPAPVCLVLIALLGFCQIPVMAQQNPEDPALPDLAPREVEIRGRLEIAFPSLQRQPLLGFNPPPRIPELPERRRPYMAPYKQESADLPPSELRRPSPPGIAGGSGYARGYVEAGAGRYLSRRVRARAGVPVGSALYVTGSLDYDGADGFTPFANLPDRTTPYDALEARLGLHHRAELFSIGATADASFDQYNLYGTGQPFRSLFEQNPRREARGGGLGLWFETTEESDVAARVTLNYDHTQVETDVLTTQTLGDSPFERTENRIDLAAESRFPLAMADLDLSGRFTSSGLDTDGLLGSTVRSYSLGAGILLQNKDGYRLHLGGRFLGFEAVGQAVSGGDRTATYVVPTLRLDLYPSPTLNIFLANQPVLETPGLRALYRENPFLVDEPRMQPSLSTVDAMLGVHYFVGPFHLSGRSGYRFFPNYRYFVHATGTSTPIYDRGLTALRYDRARIYYAEGDVALVLAGGLQASAGVSVRQGRLTEEDTDIPYFAPLTGRTSLALAFHDGKGQVQMTGRFESPRYRAFERTAETRVDAYLDVDVMARYRLTPWIGLTAWGENLLGGHLERWDGYPEMPTVFGLGLLIGF